MRKLLGFILLTMTIGTMDMEGQTNNSKRTSLAILYKLADSIKKTRNKGMATTMWVDDRPISRDRTIVEPRTMWIEDSMIQARKISFKKKKRGSTFSSKTSSF